jgi:hypothetical protein
VIVNISTGVVHVPPNHLPTFSTYASSKFAALHIFEFFKAVNPGSLSVFNLQPGEIPTAMAKKGHRDLAKDDVHLPAHCGVWLAAMAETEAAFLKGRLVWANSDLDQLLERRDDVEKENLLTVELKGWRGEFVEICLE